MVRKVVVTSVFETDIENIWCKIQDIETLRENFVNPKQVLYLMAIFLLFGKRGKHFILRCFFIDLFLLENIQST